MKPPATDLRRRAVRQLREQPAKNKRVSAHADAQRTLQELQIHQIELELQNEELKLTKAEVDAGLEKFTDLYDFAPVGYFTLAKDGKIQQVNLTGTSMVGVQRSRLLGQRFGVLLEPKCRQDFNYFLAQVFTGGMRHSGDFELLRPDHPPLIVNIAAKCQINGKECHTVVMDITDRKQAEETQRRVEVLAASNAKLKQEITRRQAVEGALTKSEEQAQALLKQSRLLQKKLRESSHQNLLALETQRKEISHELHDKISQVLIGINVRLAIFTRTAGIDPQAMAPVRELVEKSVRIVHDYARELRPAMLDQLGLIPTLRTYINDIPKRKGRKILFTASPKVEALDNDKRTVLYRVAQEALVNVAKHSHARNVSVTLHHVRGGVCLEITDDGKAFDVDLLSSSQWSHRLGLTGMRERVEMVKGVFSIISTPGKGTTIRAVIPIGKSRRRK